MNINCLNVIFPNLGLRFKVCPVAFRLWDTNVHWYGIILATAFLLSFIYLQKNSERFKLNTNDTTDVAIISSVCAVIGARSYYVLFYPGNYYKENPIRIFFINEGGIAIYGAILGGIFGIWLMNKIKKQNLGSVLDVTALSLLIGQSIGRWGNFVNQEAFGSYTTLPWAMMSEHTYMQTVHPCFLYESLGCIAIFAFLHILSKKYRPKPGTIFLLYLVFYGIIRAAIEQLRTDSLIIHGLNLKVSQVLAIALVVASSVLLIFQNKAHTNNQIIN